MTLAPDSWSHWYCAEHFYVSEYLVRTARGLNPLSTNPIKWSKTLKQFVSNLPTNCLNMFDHFVKLVHKGLKRLKEFLWSLHKNKEKWYPKIPLILCLACMKMMSLVAKCLVKMTVLALQNEIKTSEVEFHAGTHDFNPFTTFQLCDISDQWHMSHIYVTHVYDIYDIYDICIYIHIWYIYIYIYICLYDSFWWVGLVTQVDVEQGDVRVQFMFPHVPCKTFNWPETEDSCYVPIKKILYQISSPTTTTGRTYRITDEEYDKTISACQYSNMAK